MWLLRYINFTLQIQEIFQMTRYYLKILINYICSFSTGRTLHLGMKSWQIWCESWWLHSTRNEKFLFRFFLSAWRSLPPKWSSFIWLFKDKYIIEVIWLSFADDSTTLNLYYLPSTSNICSCFSFNRINSKSSQEILMKSYSFLQN